MEATVKGAVPVACVDSNVVAPKTPVFELNVKLDPLFGGRSPVASVTNNGKQVVSVDSSATVTLVEVVAVSTLRLLWSIQSTPLPVEDNT